MKQKTSLFTLLPLFALLLGMQSCALIKTSSVSQYQLADNEIDEASGLAASRKTPGILYTHNDSGGQPIVYVINHKAMLAARIYLEGVKNRDWEDIAVGPDPVSRQSCVFVGDIGDNNGKHKSVKVYRFAEPELMDTTIVVTPDIIEIVYEDGPRDAEALFVDPISGDICIISKREDEVHFYRVPYPYSLSQPNTALHEASLPMSMVVAADIDAKGKIILVKTYTDIYGYKRSGKQSIASTLAKKSHGLPYLIEPQGESIAISADGKSYFTLSESANDQPATLHHYK